MGEVTSLASTLLGLTFGSLGLLHFAWAAGIKWGFNASLPTNENGERVLNPKWTDSLIVGIGLSFFAAFYFASYFEIQLTPSDTIERVIAWIIPSIFLLRSVGDFKYFGFFKKVRSTPFAQLDSRLIIPLCLGIAAVGFYLATN